MGCVCPRDGTAAEARCGGCVMMSLFRKMQWWLQRRRKEEDLREELQFHLSEEIDARQADGVSPDEASSSHFCSRRNRMIPVR
jgi:hypothetical protein